LNESIFSSIHVTCRSGWAAAWLPPGRTKLSSGDKAPLNESIFSSIHVTCRSAKTG
jgi:hypothetical protein